MSAQPRTSAVEAHVLEMLPDEAERLLDERAQTLLGMTAGEFREAWAAGRFEGAEEREDVWQVAFLLGGSYAPGD